MTDAYWQAGSPRSSHSASTQSESPSHGPQPVNAQLESVEKLRKEMEAEAERKRERKLEREKEREREREHAREREKERERILEIEREKAQQLEKELERIRAEELQKLSQLNAEASVERDVERELERELVRVQLAEIKQAREKFEEDREKLQAALEAAKTSASVTVPAKSYTSDGYASSSSSSSASPPLSPSPSPSPASSATSSPSVSISYSFSEGEIDGEVSLLSDGEVMLRPPKFLTFLRQTSSHLQAHSHPSKRSVKKKARAHKKDKHHSDGESEGEAVVVYGGSDGEKSIMESDGELPIGTSDTLLRQHFPSFSGTAMSNIPDISDGEISVNGHLPSYFIPTPIPFSSSQPPIYPSHNNVFPSRSSSLSTNPFHDPATSMSFSLKLDSLSSSSASSFPASSMHRQDPFAFTQNFSDRVPFESLLDSERVVAAEAALRQQNKEERERDKKVEEQETKKNEKEEEKNEKEAKKKEKETKKEEKKAKKAEKEAKKQEKEAEKTEKEDKKKKNKKEEIFANQEESDQDLPKGRSHPNAQASEVSKQGNHLIEKEWWEDLEEDMADL